MHTHLNTQIYDPIHILSAQHTDLSVMVHTVSPLFQRRKQEDKQLKTILLHSKFVASLGYVKPVSSFSPSIGRIDSILVQKHFGVGGAIPILNTHFLLTTAAYIIKSINITFILGILNILGKI